MLALHLFWNHMCAVKCCLMSAFLPLASSSSSGDCMQAKKDIYPHPKLIHPSILQYLQLMARNAKAVWDEVNDDRIIYNLFLTLNGKKLRLSLGSDLAPG